MAGKKNHQKTKKNTATTDGVVKIRNDVDYTRFWVIIWSLLLFRTFWPKQSATLIVVLSMNNLYRSMPSVTSFIGRASTNSLRFDKSPSSLTSYTYQAGLSGEETARYSFEKSGENASPFGHTNSAKEERGPGTEHGIDPFRTLTRVSGKHSLDTYRVEDFVQHSGVPNLRAPGNRPVVPVLLSPCRPYFRMGIMYVLV